MLLIHFIRAQNKDPKALDEWEESGQAKVVLKAQSEEELYVLVGWLVGWLVSSCYWLVGWLVEWLVGSWLAVGLVGGWLASRLLICS